jgi:hypothetical protein
VPTTRASPAAPEAGALPALLKPLHLARKTLFDRNFWTEYSGAMKLIGKAIGWAIVMECIALLLAFIGVLLGGAPPCGTGTPIGQALLLLGVALHFPTVLFFLHYDGGTTFWPIAIQTFVWIVLFYWWFDKREQAKEQH